MEAAAYREMAALEDRHWWFVGRRRIIEALLQRLKLPPNAKILEIGCGSGGNFSMLSEYGRLYAGEYADEPRKAAAERGIASAVVPCALPDKFPFEDERFDLIVMFDVLEHIEDDAASLANVRRHLADGGWFVLTVPAFPFLWSSHDTYNHHFRRYTRAMLLERLHGAGLKESYCSYFNSWLFPLVAAVRMLRGAGSPEDASKGDLAMPAAPLNDLLAGLFASERFAMGRLSLPFGVSLIASARAAPAGPGGTR